MASRPLEGVKVFELAHIMAGPVCGMMLADLGADVIKVEPVVGGDPSRTFGPDSDPDASAPFMMLNRNKRGIAINLKEPTGAALMRRLLAGADVLIENFRAGTLERLGLGYDTVREQNPGIVYCEISGFGRSGPMADHAGFDLIAQGYSGLMDITGSQADDGPMKVGAPVTDIMAGVLGALGVTAAVAERARTGRGRQVDTSLFEAGILQTLWHSSLSLAGLPVPTKMGTAHPLTAPYEAFQTRDGWVTVGASNQATWLRLLSALDAAELENDPRFADNANRHEHRVALAGLLAPRFAARTTDEWVQALNGAGVPAGPVLSIDAMLRHAQTTARSMVVSVTHDKAGATETMGSPLKLDGQPLPIERAAPTLGQHTDEVLTECGIDDAEITALRGDDVIR